MRILRDLLIIVGTLALCLCLLSTCGWPMWALMAFVLYAVFKKPG